MNMVSSSLVLATGALLVGHFVSATIPDAARRLRSPKSPHLPSFPPVFNEKRAVSTPSFTIPTFSNPKAANYHVNSSALPLVTFPLQDSWAGLLPISSSLLETRKLFFWYWPSSASGGSDSLTIWLNGITLLDLGKPCILIFTLI